MKTNFIINEHRSPACRRKSSAHDGSFSFGRKNAVSFQRLLLRKGLTYILTLALIFSAFAGLPMAKGGEAHAATGDTITINVSQPENGPGYVWEDKTIIFNTDEAKNYEYTIEGNNESGAVENILINAEIKMLFWGENLKGTSSVSVSLLEGSSLELELREKSSLGEIVVPSGASLTIGGIGSLNVSGRIGGGAGGDSGNITITDKATVTAAGGIGGGSEGNGGNITIKGGATVTATGEDGAAGIGGGSEGNGGNITIEGGSTVTATGEDGAAIKGAITIKGSAVTAIGGIDAFTLSIDGASSVKAFVKSSASAIQSANQTSTRFISGYFEQLFSKDRVFKNTGAAVTTSFTLPANYASFAYATASQSDRIDVYDSQGKTRLWHVQLASGSSLDIPSQQLDAAPIALTWGTGGDDSIIDVSTPRTPGNGAGYIWNSVNGTITFNSGANNHAYTILRSSADKQVVKQILLEGAVSMKMTLCDLNMTLSDTPIKLSSSAKLELTLSEKNSFAGGIHVPSGAFLTIGGIGSGSLDVGNIGGGNGENGGDSGNITIEGGATVTATGEDGAAIKGAITITNSEVTAIGGISALTLSIDRTSSVKAFVKSSAPAIQFTINQALTQFISGYIEPSSEDRVFRARKNNGEGTVTTSFTLPAGYASFAYSTKSNSLQIDRIDVYNSQGAMRLGQVQQLSNSSPNIHSRIDVFPIALKLIAGSGEFSGEWDDYIINVCTTPGTVSGYDWDPVDKTITFNSDANNYTYTVYSSDGTNQVVKQIVLEKSVSVKMTLSALNMTASDAPIISLSSGAALKLTLSGESLLTGGGIHVPSGASLTIGGIGSLDAGNIGGENGGDGGDSGAITIEGGATVTATGKNGAAGIGGGSGGNGGNITIKGGARVTATGEDGAGIGGGKGSTGGEIAIENATVTATGEDGAAGIGGGSEGNGGNITIENATVTATGEDGAAIRGAITIKGSAVTAIGGISASALSIDGTSSVKAFVKSSASAAIQSANQTSTQFISGYFEPPFPEQDRVFRAYKDGRDEVTTSFTLPAGYISFSYATGTTEPQSDRIYAYYSQGKTFLGQVQLESNSSFDIPSQQLGEAPIALKLVGGDDPSGNDHYIDVSTRPGDGPGYIYSSNSKTITFNSDANGRSYTVCHDGTTQVVKQILASGASVKMTLSALNMASSNAPTISLSSGAELELTLSGENSFAFGSGIHVPPGAELTIGGTGSLDAGNIGGGNGENGGDSGAITIGGGATVTARGGYGAAGIGGGSGGNGGNITIKDGATVIAIGDIGGGNGEGNGGDGGTITIEGGATVTATGGIGGGDDTAIAGVGGDGGAITIENSTVTAIGIGGGNGGRGGWDYIVGSGGDGGTIKIKGSTVTVTGGEGDEGEAAVIGGGEGNGGGNGGDGGKITIEGSTVIGSIGGGNGDDGTGGDGGEIKIKGSTVTAIGKFGAVGIGGGGGNRTYGDNNVNGGTGGEITIEGSTVIATGIGGGNGRGNGAGAGGGVIKIESSTVTANGGIGGGNGSETRGNGAGGDSENITIGSGATVTAIGGIGGGKGSGNGAGGDSKNITIEGGATVTATGGIGGGNGGGNGAGGGSGGEIKIEDGATVTANGGIGGGNGGGNGAGGDSENITIGSSATVTANGIGGGNGGNADGGDSGNIKIEDSSTVTADGGIGGGNGEGHGGDSENITIEGGAMVTAAGRIGGGNGGDNRDGGSGGEIKINGSKVTADGGIGGGSGDNKGGYGGNITITDSKVTATGKDGAAGIGGGRSAIEFSGGDGGVIKIENATVTATGINGAVGIGGGRGGWDGSGGSGGEITIKGSAVTANGGIGGGNNDADGGAGGGGNITIEGGVIVTANGGIGGGNGWEGSGGSGGEITINGSTVTATEEDGVAIGGGNGGNGGNITIENATVTATGKDGVAIGGGKDANGATAINSSTVTAIGGIGASTLSIDDMSSVKAFVKSSASSAIQSTTTDQASTQLISGYFDPSFSEDRVFKAHKDNGKEVTTFFTLPADYASFAYTTKSNSEQKDRINVYDSGETTLLGQVQIASGDSSLDIPSQQLGAAPRALRLLIDVNDSIDVSTTPTLDSVIGYTWNSNSETITFNSGANGRAYTVFSSGSGTQVVKRIVLESGVRSVKITLSALNMTSSNASIISLSSGAGLELTLSGENLLTGGGIHVPSGATLTIGGIGSLDVGGIGGTGGGAGDSGKITINSSTVTATGENGAAIGGGSGSAGGEITIKGSTVTAIGGISASILSIDEASFVKAFGRSTNSAIQFTTGQALTQFISGYIESPSPEDRVFEAYKDNGKEVTTSFTLPAGYASFAYATKTTGSQIDYIYTYDSQEKLLGQVQLASDSSLGIPSQQLGAAPIALKSVAGGEDPKAGYTVKFNSNGGAIISGPDSIKVSRGAVIVSLPIASRTGYTFAGWFTTQAAIGGSILTTSSAINASVTYYARWTPKQFTLVFYANKGTVSPKSKKITYDKAYGSLPIPKRKGYTFKGWFTKISGGSKVSSAKINKDAKNVAVYAQWTPKKYKLKFSLAGGKLAKKFKKTKKGKKKIPALTLSYNAKYGSLPKLSRKGYKFLGWYTTKKKGKTKVRAKKRMGAKSVRIYARWKKK